MKVFRRKYICVLWCGTVFKYTLYLYFKYRNSFIKRTLTHFNVSALSAENLRYFKAGIKYAVKVILEKGLTEGIEELEKLCLILENKIDEATISEVLENTAFTSKIKIVSLSEKNTVEIREASH